MGGNSSNPRQVAGAVLFVLVSFTFAAWVGPMLTPRKGRGDMAAEMDPRAWMIAGDGTEEEVSRAKDAIADTSWLSSSRTRSRIDIG